MAALMMATGVFFATFSPPASAAPTWGGGDCWRTGVPLWCWLQHVDGQQDLYYNVDEFSAAGRPNWHSAFITALQHWNTANGPQSFSTAARSGARPIYYELAFDAQLGTGTLGQTWVCDTAGTCHTYLSDNGFWVDHAYVRLNASSDGVPDNSGSLTVTTFGHETGHAVGEAHSTDDRDIMSTNAATTLVQGPTDAGDIGALPPCNGSLGSTNSNNQRAGTRCVSRWTS